MGRVNPRDADRFWAKVNKAGANGCWEWTAGRDKKGYGRFNLAGKNRRAHGVAYESLVGLIPEGKTLDHLCRNRACVNPDHLEPVTTRENTLRGESQVARNARKTHCIRGHDLSGPHITITRRGHRRCRLCDNERQRRSYALRNAT